MKLQAPRLRSWIRLFVVLLGIVILIPRTYAAALKFADDTEPLAVDYKALASGDQRLQVIVVNNGSEAAEVTRQIVLLGLKERSANSKPVFADESLLILRKDDPRSLTIAPGGAIILEFVPNADITPAEGQYTGQLIVSDVRSHIDITKSVVATVSGVRSHVTITKDVGLQKGGPTNPVKAPVEIVGSNTPRYHYDKLVSSKDTKERIRVAVRNTGPTTQQLSGRVHVQVSSLEDRKGPAVDLIFRMVEQDDKAYQEVAMTAVKPHHIKVVTFELLDLPITPLPGSYEGKVVLTAQDTPDICSKWASSSVS